MSEEMRCHDCGQCCHGLNEKHEPTINPCKYLIRLKSGRTTCRIYSSRLRTKINAHSFCAMRENSACNYEGCEYNALDESKDVYKVISGKEVVLISKGKKE